MKRHEIMLSGFCVVVASFTAHSHLLAADAVSPSDAAAILTVKNLGGTVRQIAARSQDREVQFNLSGRTLTDDGLAQVAKLSRVVWLNLRGTKITSAGLAHVGRLTELRKLHLRARVVG